jgi:Mg-chelatase subunit ChlD
MRDIIPRSTFEAAREHALHRYGLVELLLDPEELDRLDPDPALLSALLRLTNQADPRLKEVLYKIARKVVDDLTQRLRARFDKTPFGALDRTRRSHLKRTADLDWPKTIRANLRNWDPERKVLIADRPVFSARKRRHLPWDVILCVDQSGSMTESLIHSAVMAAILHSLPGVRLRMLLFDTSVVDVTDKLADPLDLLLSVQMGGGTNIAGAMGHCETLVRDPSQTLMVLVSDFYEGGNPAALRASVRRLAEARVKMLGLAAITDHGTPAYHRELAAELDKAGMPVAAMTPDRFAEWFAETLV